MTNDAKAVLAEIYKQYLERQDTDDPNATEFSSDFANTCDVFGKPMPNTIQRCLNDLSANGYIKVSISDDFELTNDGIAYMDGETGRKIEKILSFIRLIKP